MAARNLKVLFEEQHRFLNYFFQHLDYEPLERFCRVSPTVLTCASLTSRRMLPFIYSRRCTRLSCCPAQRKTSILCAWLLSLTQQNRFMSPRSHFRAAQACLDCQGVILLTGVGKSGFIAAKISQTLVSTGTRAMFLSPTDALHGDIGIVGPADLLVAFSKSGSSEELLKLMPYAKVRHRTSCQLLCRFCSTT